MLGLGIVGDIYREAQKRMVYFTPIYFPKRSEKIKSKLRKKYFKKRK